MRRARRRWPGSAWPRCRRPASGRRCHGGVVPLPTLAGQRDTAGLDLTEPHPQAALGDGARRNRGTAAARPAPETTSDATARRARRSGGGPWILPFMMMPLAAIRRYSSSMSSTRGVRWLMWVDRTPAMSAATADTCDSSSYQPVSIGSRDSANAAVARATKSSASSAAAPPAAAIAARVGDERGIEELPVADEPLHPGTQVVGEESGIGGGQHRGEDPERVVGQLVLRRSAGTPSTPPAPGRPPHAGRSSRPGTCRRRRTGRRPRRVRGRCRRGWRRGVRR